MHREPRVVTRCRVEFMRLQQPVVAETENLSRRGAFVRTQALVPVGEVLELAIALPGGKPVQIRSRVAHQLTPAAARALGRHAGMGFEFLDQASSAFGVLLRELDALLDLPDSGVMRAGQSPTVLIMEGHEALRDRLANCLRAMGAEVNTVNSGGEAYAFCLTRPPDILLASGADRAAGERGGMDAWTLLKMLQARPKLKRIPVMLLSEEDDDITRLQAFRLGAADFVPMPFTDEEIRIRLKRIGSGTRRRADAERVVLKGKLSEISLAMLLSMLEYERKTGILVVLAGQDAGRLFVDSGRVLAVEGPSSGSSLDNLMRCLGWSHGEFEFVACAVHARDELGMSTQHILLQHAQQEDEAARER